MTSAVIHFQKSLYIFNKNESRGILLLKIGRATDPFTPELVFFKTSINMCLELNLQIKFAPVLW